MVRKLACLRILAVLAIGVAIVVSLGTAHAQEVEPGASTVGLIAPPDPWTEPRAAVLRAMTDAGYHNPFSPGYEAALRQAPAIVCSTARLYPTAVENPAIFRVALVEMMSRLGHGERLIYLDCQPGRYSP
jgi:hypothetical protein